MNYVKFYTYNEYKEYLSNHVGTFVYDECDAYDVYDDRACCNIFSLITISSDIEF